MKVMLVFDAVILLFGIYMVISSLQMKKSGRINAMVIAEEEMKKCKDTAGFNCIYLLERGGVWRNRGTGGTDWYHQRTHKFLRKTDAAGTCDFPWIFFVVSEQFKDCQGKIPAYLRC